MILEKTAGVSSHTKHCLCPSSLSFSVISWEALSGSEMIGLICRSHHPRTHCTDLRMELNCLVSVSALHRAHEAWGLEHSCVHWEGPQEDQYDVRLTF